MNDNDDNNSDDSNNNEHDQLPSVEEYKSTMADPRSHRIDPKRIMEAVMGSDSDDDDLDEDGNIHYLEEGVDDGKDEVYNDGQDYYMNEEDEQEIFHDQLPSVDEIHAQYSSNTSSSSTKCLLRCGYTVLVILFLLVIILPPVLLTRKNDYEQRKKRIIDTLINHLGIDDDDKSLLLEDVSTPQGKAVEFLATEQYFDGDEILWKENGGTKLIERYTAVVFYYATGGPNWKYKLYFLSSTRDVCDWNAYFQISGSGEIVQEGIICDNDNDGSEDDDDK
eukprot:scaffold1707_cov88-Cylindrotheca_fusiformis.AAC.1